MRLWTRQLVVVRMCLFPNQAKPDFGQASLLLYVYISAHQARPDSEQASLLLYVCLSAHQARPDSGQASVSGQHERPGEDDFVRQGVPGRESGTVSAVR